MQVSSLGWSLFSIHAITQVSHVYPLSGYFRILVLFHTLAVFDNKGSSDHSTVLSATLFNSIYHSLLITHGFSMKYNC